MGDYLPGVSEFSDFLKASESPTSGANGLCVRFHLQPVLDQKASDKEHRPIYVEKEYVEIRVPGDRTLSVDEEVTDDHKRRFAQAYQAWKLRGETASDGMPLEQWPGATKADVEELRFFNVRTVEQLAALTDANARNIGKVLNLRKKAQDWIEASKGHAPIARLEGENAKLANEIEALKAALKEQGDRMAQLGQTPATIPAAPAKRSRKTAQAKG